MKPAERKRRRLQSARSKGRVATDESGKQILFKRLSKQKGYAIEEI